jgi:hypothetical protein
MAQQPAAHCRTASAIVRQHVSAAALGTLRERANGTPVWSGNQTGTTEKHFPFNEGALLLRVAMWRGTSTHETGELSPSEFLFCNNPEILNQAREQ